MPAMPAWAEGARIVYDTEHPFAFIRKGRRALWEPYFVHEGTLTRLAVPGRMKLEAAREKAMEAVGEAIGRMVMWLHPHADKKHMGLAGGYVGAKYVPSRHACGIDYAEFQTVQTVAAVTCPVCYAVMVEDFAAQSKVIGPEVVAEARQHVRDVRAFNALAQTVDGEDATTRL